MVDLGNAALDLSFYALADATRRDIVKRLCRQKLRIVDLAAEYDASLMNTSKHVKILESAGLVSIHKIGTSRWCEFNSTGIKAISELIQFYERFWSHQLDGLKELAEKTETKGKKEIAARPEVVFDLISKGQLFFSTGILPGSFKIDFKEGGEFSFEWVSGSSCSGGRLVP